MPALNKRLHIARRGVLYSLVLCTLILLIGGVGFWALDPGVKTLSDGLWLAFTTAATVGYGDITAQTPEAKLFTVSVIVLGVAVFATSLTAVIAPMVSRSLQRIVNHKGPRMKRENHFVVVGS